MIICNWIGIGVLRVDLSVVHFRSGDCDVCADFVSAFCRETDSSISRNANSDYCTMCEMVCVSLAFPQSIISRWQIRFCEKASNRAGELAVHRGDHCCDRPIHPALSSPIGWKMRQQIMIETNFHFILHRITTTCDRVCSFAVAELHDSTK